MLEIVRLCSYVRTASQIKWNHHLQTDHSDASAADYDDVDDDDDDDDEDGEQRIK